MRNRKSITAEEFYAICDAAEESANITGNWFPRIDELEAHGTATESGILKNIYLLAYLASDPANRFGLEHQGSSEYKATVKYAKDRLLNVNLK